MVEFHHQPFEAAPPKEDEEKNRPVRARHHRLSITARMYVISRDPLPAAGAALVARFSSKQRAYGSRHTTPSRMPTRPSLAEVFTMDPSEGRSSRASQPRMPFQTP